MFPNFLTFMYTIKSDKRINKNRYAMKSTAMFYTFNFSQLLAHVIGSNNVGGNHSTVCSWIIGIHFDSR